MQYTVMVIKIIHQLLMKNIFIYLFSNVKRNEIYLMYFRCICTTFYITFLARFRNFIIPVI